MLLPLLLKTENSRIVNTGCVNYHDESFPFTPSVEDINIETRTYHWYRNYCETKLYTVLFTLGLKEFVGKKYGKEAAGGLKVLCCDPGRSRTGLIRKAPSLIKKIHSILGVYFWFLIKDAIAGAQHLFNVCLSDFESMENGGYYSNFKLTDVNPVVDGELVRNLWNVSIETLGNSIEKFGSFEKFSE